jgi:hypothetical protein
MTGRCSPGGVLRRGGRGMEHTKTRDETNCKFQIAIQSETRRSRNSICNLHFDNSICNLQFEICNLVLSLHFYGRGNSRAAGEGMP